MAAWISAGVGNDTAVADDVPDTEGRGVEVRRGPDIEIISFLFFFFLSRRRRKEYL